jgi:UDP-glucose 4-epimerase
LKSILEDVDEIVDLAYTTIPKTSFEDPENDILTNLPKSVQLFQVASELPIRKLIFVSSGGTVYGHALSPLISENHANNPISPYGITKLALEKYARMYHSLQNLPVVCVRPGNAYGEKQKPFQGQGFIATAIASILEQREIILFGGNTSIRDFIYVEDLAEGIYAALHMGKPGEVYNIGTGVGHSNKNIIDLLIPLAKKSDLQVNISVRPRRIFDVSSNILDSAKIYQDTGWLAKTSLEEGIMKTWCHYLDQYRVKY